MDGLRPASVRLNVTVFASVAELPVSKVSVSVFRKSPAASESPTFRFKMVVPDPAPRLRLVKFEIALPVPSKRLRVDPPPTSMLVIAPGFVKPPRSAKVLLPVAINPVVPFSAELMVKDPASVLLVLPW